MTQNGNQEVSIRPESLIGTTIMEMDNQYDILLFEPKGKNGDAFSLFHGEIIVGDSVMFCQFNRDRICFASEKLREYKSENEYKQSNL